MELGISSLGYLSEISNKNNKDPIDLQIESFKQTLDFSEKSGIKIVELVIEPTEILKKENYHKLVDLVKSYALEIQIHGPFIDVNICSFNNHISRASVQSYLETIEFTHVLNSKMLTIHPGYANFLLKSIRSFNIQQLKKNIKILLDISNKHEIDICLENMPNKTNIMTDHENITKIYNIINREDLFITYDTSHYFMCDGDVEQLWEKFYNKIRNIHIVDSFDKKSDKHPQLGIGIINFKEIFEVIKSYNYNGPLIIELSSSTSLSKSINFINKFL